MIKTDYAYSVLKPEIISVINLVEYLKIPITRKTIREFFLAKDTYPSISLFDICDALESWKIKSIASEIPKEMFYKAPLPFLACIKEDECIYFVLITEISESHVPYIHPKTYYNCPNEHFVIQATKADFFSIWTSTVVIILIKNTSGELNYISIKEHEEIEKEIYKNSIVLKEDFFTEEECNILIRFTEENKLYNRSKIGDKSGVISDFRTSSSAKVKMNEFDFLIQKIEQACEITNNKIVYLENPQTARYSVGQKFTLHFDTGGDIFRRHTGVIYLNDDYEGGETYFSEIDYHVKPKMARAVFFPSLSDDNLPVYSAHASLPILKGTKYVFILLFNDSPIEKLNSI